MSSYEYFNVCGKIVSSRNGYFQWTINDFLSNAFFGSIDSPCFKFLDSSYKIQLKLDQDENYMTIQFCKHSSDPFRRLCDSTISDVYDKLHVTFGMKTGYRGKLETRSGETNEYGGFRVSVWMTCSEMFERRCEILHNGCLTVYCELKRIDSNDSVSLDQGNLLSNETDGMKNQMKESITLSKNKSKVIEDLEQLLISGKNSDVTLKVKEKEFPAHQSILSARSVVFQSMFSHDMMEKATGIVAIDDCDPVTFPDFLSYLYTGSIEHLSGENVCQLFSTSDKYDVKELKEECKLFMISNLSVPTFCDIMSLGLQHNDEELTESAIDFFCQNTSEIIKTVKWMKFLQENPSVGNELFIKAH